MSIGMPGPVPEGESAGHGSVESRQARACKRAGPGRIPAVDSRALFGCASALHILHDGQTYCLRITRSSKLILTK